jgi:hypothetical protein
MTRTTQVPLSDLRTSFKGTRGLWNALNSAMSAPSTAGLRPAGLNDAGRPLSSLDAFGLPVLEELLLVV